MITDQRKKHILAFLPVMKELEKKGYDPVGIMFGPAPLTMEIVEACYMALCRAKEKYPTWNDVLDRWMDRRMRKRGKKMPICKECNWWKLTGKSSPDNGEESGRCHGKPPTAIPVVMPVVVSKLTGEVRPQIVEVTLWPTVPASCEACGDFKPNVLLEPDTKTQSLIEGKRITDGQ